MRHALHSHRRFAAIIAAALVALIIPAAWFVYSAVASSPAHPIRLYDDKRGTSFSLVADPSSGHAGRFIFAVQGVGQYRGGSRESVRELPNGRIQVHYKGPAELTPVGEGLTSSEAVSLVLNANIDRGRNAATVTLSEGRPGREFQLVVHPTKGDIGSIAAQYNAAAVTSNPAALYALTAKAALGNLTQDQFAEMLQEQIAENGRIINIEGISSPVLETNAAGLVFSTVQQRVLYEKDGVQQVQDFTSVFLDEEGEWRFWFSEPTP